MNIDDNHRLDLFNSHTSFALSLAGQDEDLRQECLIALWSATATHDPVRGPFLSYARPIITSRAAKFHRTNRTIPLSAHASTRSRAVAAATLELRVELLREPSAEEISERSGVQLRFIQRAVSQGEIGTASLDRVQGFSLYNECLQNPRSFADTTADESTLADVRSQVDVSQIRTILEVEMMKLGEREQMILTWFLEGSTKAEISRSMNLSRERIRQILNKIIQKFRQHMGVSGEQVIA